MSNFLLSHHPSLSKAMTTIIGVIALVASLHLIATPLVPTVFAGCVTASYCDASPGTCSTTANGGQPIQIVNGGWQYQCAQTNCTCTGSGSCSISGSSCSVPQSCTTTTSWETECTGEGIYETCSQKQVTKEQCVGGGSGSCSCQQNCTQSTYTCQETHWETCCTPGVPPSSGSPIPTPPPSIAPSPGGASCGDGDCNGGELCNGCINDCGYCGTTPIDDIGDDEDNDDDDDGGEVCEGTSVDGIPGGTTITPANGGTTLFDATTSTAAISWTVANKADEYNLELYPKGSNCGDWRARCVTLTTNSYSFSPDSSASQYSFRVRPVNTSCGRDTGSWTDLATFTITGSITGGFFLDLNAESIFDGTSCSPSGGAPISPGGTAAIGAETRLGSVGGTITGTTFSIPAPYWPATGIPNNIVSLTPGEATPGDPYECTCPIAADGRCEISGIASPQAGVNFYLRPASLSNNAWWQVFGGSSFAAAESGSAIVSQVPPTCTLASGCSPNVLRKDQLDTADSAGFALTGGGEVDTSETAGYQTTGITDRTEQVVAKGTVPDKFRETYEYFYRQYSLGTNPAATDDFKDTSDDAQKPTVAPDGAKTAYYHEGTLVIQDRWHLQTTDSIKEIVVFVKGDLVISDPGNLNQLIQVDPGTFLAFIVSGDITVENNVGNEVLTDNTPNIEGVFIADRTFRIDSVGIGGGGDETFVGAGTFAGWENVELLRDYASSSDVSRIEENNTKATERFIFRPDFVRTLPARMAAPRYVWQESN